MSADNNYHIVKASPDDARIAEGLRLAEEVFMECEAPIYTPEGTENFIAFVRGERLRDHISCGKTIVYLCLDGDSVCGICAVREISHICLLFVRTDMQGTGIGRMLVSELIKDIPDTDITVNSAPPAVSFYSSLGFKETDMELIEDGIRFTPMKRKA